MSDAKATLRELTTLPLLALLAALLLAAVYLATQARIANNERRAADALIIDALTLPGDTVLNDTSLTSAKDQQLLTLPQPRQMYLARQHGRIIALIVPVTAREGYNGAIDFMVGIAPAGNIIGVRALNHRETAGLGDRIDADKSAWIKQFIGKSLAAIPAERWTTKNAGGDFDQITGATVTSRATIDAVYRALQYVELHREQLLQSDTNTQPAGAQHE